MGRLGFEKWFDFSHKHTFSGKFKNWLFIFGLDLLWTTAMSAILLFVVGINKIQLATLLTAIIGQKILYANLLGGVSGQLFVSPLMLFLLACVIAPLWEEVPFRVFPIKLAGIIGAPQVMTFVDRDDLPAKKSSFLFWMCCFSSIIFGLAHGSVLNILFQGVSGFFFSSWLYLENNESYWSVVAAHALWNFMVIFGLRVLMS